MKVERIRTVAGPNVYSHHPVIVMTLDLEDLTEKETIEFTSFNERLLACLPGLRDHHCSLGVAGGFVVRLHEGTYFGHVVEHVAIELATLAEVGANHGKTRNAGEPSLYNIAVEYTSEQASHYLLARAVELVEAVLRSETFPVGKEIWEAKRIASLSELGPSTRAILTAATRRNIPWRREGEESLVQLGYGKYRHYIQASITDHTSATAVDLVQDKEQTKRLLERAGIPTPEGRLVRSAAEALSAMHELVPPVVVKPTTSRQGNGISIGVGTDEDMAKAFNDAASFSDSVIVEKLLTGRNYRLLVINDQLVAASERLPSAVVGDGEHAINELIDLENANPLRGEGHGKPLTTIKIDQAVVDHLRKNGRTLKDIPGFNERVTLSECVNLSGGATARDVTDDVHPSIVSMCERAARLTGIDICGIDLMTDDISRPLDKGGVLELNAGPGLRMHCHPSEGKPRDVGAAIVEMLYPKGNTGRIPIVSITGTNGKTTVTRMIGHVMQACGQWVGMTTTDGIYIGGERVVEGDTTGPRSAMAVLSDPSVEIAVLETARGGIVRGGLGYDWSDVGVVTSIGEDHIGQDGIKTIEDVVFIKSLVAERVREGGTIVLNADNPHVVSMIERPAVAQSKKQVFYFSLDETNPVIRRHLSDGGTAFVYSNRRLWEVTGSETEYILDVASVPATMHGLAEFQIQNLLAAIAACRAQEVSREVIGASLQGFFNYANNPGRLNLYRLNGGHVMVDYGHNADAFAAVCRMARKWKDHKVTGVITIPGDRDNAIIERAGRVAARGFDRLIIREDRDLRGRVRGAVAEILCNAARSEAATTECEVVLDEGEALHHAVRTMEPGEVVFVFYEKLAPLRQILQKYSAQPVESLNGFTNSSRCS